MKVIKPSYFLTISIFLEAFEAKEANLWGQDLERHVPVQLGIGGPIHHAHAPFTDLLQNLLMTDGLADHAVSLTDR